MHTSLNVHVGHHSTPIREKKIKRSNDEVNE